jgi:uncharacterized protein
MRHAFTGACVLSLFLLPAAAQTPAPPKPSFDCAKARRQVEHLICKSSGLAALDLEKASLLRRARTAASTPDAVNAEEDTWLSYRNGCLDTACLADAYRHRIMELQRWVN